MSYNFILQIALMIGLGAMIYLIARALPRVGDTIEKTEEKSQNRLDRLIALLPIEKLDFIFSNFMEKLLRRLKLLFMKCDNILTNYLDKFKRTNGEKEKTGLFDKISQEDVQASTAQEGELNGELDKSG